MKKSILFLLLLFVIPSVSFAQKTEKIFMDEDWEPTTEKYAAYYRLVKKSKAGYEVTDHYMNGRIQMKGTFADKKMDVYNGRFEWYDSNEVLTRVKHYIKDRLDGEIIEYYPNGQVKIKEFYTEVGRNGPYAEYYPDGSLRAEAQIVEGQVSGPANRFFQNGTPQLKMEIDNNGNGLITAFYKNGQIQYKGSVVNGYRHGEWLYYDSTGVLEETILKREELEIRKIQTNLKKIKENEPLPKRYMQLNEIFFSKYYFGFDGEAGIIEFPDIDAEFIGGKDGLARYIQQNIVYPKEALKRNKQGRVYVSFVVETDGRVTNVKVERGPYLLRAESIRIVQNMPNWKPGEHKGKKVRTRCRLPINYTLN